MQDKRAENGVTPFFQPLEQLTQLIMYWIQLWTKMAT